MLGEVKQSGASAAIVNEDTAVWPCDMEPAALQQTDRAPGLQSLTLGSVTLRGET